MTLADHVRAVEAAMPAGKVNTVLRGDADDDGEVTIADVSTLVDYLLGNPVDPFNTLNADADEDGEIAIADVSALIDYLLNGTWD